MLGAEQDIPYSLADAAFVHPLAHFENSEIGPRSKVWQFASVIRNAKIGEDCSIASCVIVDGAILGDRVIVSHSAFIDPGIEIGNDVFIGPHVSLCNDAWPRVSKEHFDIAKMISGEFVTTVICDGASLGANVVVLPGVTIGERAMIGAGSIVTRNVPQDCLYRRDGTWVQINDETISMQKRMRAAY